MKFSILTFVKWTDTCHHVMSFSGKLLCSAAYFVSSAKCISEEVFSSTVSCFTASSYVSSIDSSDNKMISIFF